MIRTFPRLLVAAALMVAVTSALAEDLLGLRDTGESRVEIHACGELLCGRIAELDEPLDEDGPEQRSFLKPRRS